MPNSADAQYLNIARVILNEGDRRPTRNGDRITWFGDPQMRFDLSEGFPLLTTKKVWFDGIVHELLWFLRGETNIKSLNEVGVHIWDQNADENGDLGPVYGSQWRSWPALEFPPAEGEIKEGTWPVALAPRQGKVDQIAKLVDSLKNDPYGTRHVLTAWNPAEVDQMQLPPCHMIAQFDVGTDGKLNCKMFQRSADWFLGVPFNMASYALLTMMLAKVVGLEPGVFTHTFGNAHIYDNDKSHVDQMKEQIARQSFDLPTVKIDYTGQDIDKFKFEDFELVGYKHHPALKGEMSV